MLAFPAERPSWTLAVILLCGCGGGGDSMTTADAANDLADARADLADAAVADALLADAGPSSFPAHIAYRSCAPNDGPALTVVLGTASAQECAMDVDQPSLAITVYLPSYAIDPPVDYGFGGEVDTGFAEYCPGGDGPCASGGIGTLHVQTFEDGVGATGSFQVSLGSGPSAGSFDASACPPLLCG
jgi:hypothetical protein